MSGPSFLTVPDELLEHAEAAAAHFDSYGYKVAVEKRVIGYPYVPTLTAKRSPTTLLIDVDTKVRLGRADQWSRYCRSCAADVRAVIVLPPEAPRSGAEEVRLRDLGVGLYLSLPDGLVESIPPRDVSLNVALQPLSELPTKIRKLLGSSYELFDAGKWRDGFGDACQALETAAATYLAREMTANRVVLITPTGKRSKLKASSVTDQTLGQLALTFGMIRNPTQTDIIVGDVLKRIVAARNKLRHNKSRRGTEALLRKNVGLHMWRLVDALKELV